MGNVFQSLVLSSALFFAAFSASTSYQLQNYSLSGAASNSSASTTYQLESSTGQIQSVNTSSATYSALAGSLQAQQASVPPAPTLGNGAGTYYNKLDMIINTGGNPSDVTFAVAVSTNSFVTTNYVQIDGSLGPVPLFQTYVQWGGATGMPIIGLANSTTYQVKVSAMQGKFTHSAYGPVATSSTTAPNIVFSITPNALTLPNLLAGSVVTGANMTAAFATNATYGGNVYVSDSNTGLKSNSKSYTIASATGNLTLLGNGYGGQATSVTQTSGGPFAIASPYNGITNTVGLINTTPQPIFTTGTPIVGGSGVAVLKAKASSTDPASGDYQDTLTFIAAASF